MSPNNRFAAPFSGGFRRVELGAADATEPLEKAREAELGPRRTLEERCYLRAIAWLLTSESGRDGLMIPGDATPRNLRSDTVSRGSGQRRWDSKWRVIIVSAVRYKSATANRSWARDGTWLRGGMSEFLS